jgi:hypothetical protein
MKVKSIQPKDGINAKSHRKENAFMYEYAVIAKHKGEFTIPLTIRIYGTQAANYACLWACNIQDGVYFSGSGRATGYGYHRPSEAAGIAIQSAGIELDAPIGGRGDTAIEDALRAIATHYGYTDFYIHKAHA